jgi:hypothetical protein
VYGDMNLTLPSEEMTFDLIGDKYDMRVVLYSINLENPDKASDSENLESKEEQLTFRSHISGIVLIKDKSATVD